MQALKLSNCLGVVLVPRTAILKELVNHPLVTGSDHGIVFVAHEVTAEDVGTAGSISVDLLTDALANLFLGGIRTQESILRGAAAVHGDFILKESHKSVWTSMK